jgi:hypothetical protein
MNSKLINHDLYGINLYCGIETLSERIKNILNIRFNKPYLITLLGQWDIWDVDTKSDIPIEVSNTIKDQQYEGSHEKVFY